MRVFQGAAVVAIAALVSTAADARLTDNQRRAHQQSAQAHANAAKAHADHARAIERVERGIRRLDTAAKAARVSPSKKARAVGGAYTAGRHAGNAGIAAYKNHRRKN